NRHQSLCTEFHSWKIVKLLRMEQPENAAPEPGPLGLDDPERSQAGSGSEYEDPLDASESEADLEEFETGLYLCRWPNGEFSLVKADNRKDAVVQLDQWAGAEPAWLVPLETCMVDFRLNDRGESSWANLKRKPENLS